MLQVDMVRNPSTNDGYGGRRGCACRGKFLPSIEMSMQQKYRDANSTFIQWRQRKYKSPKSAMHKRPTIKIVRLMGSRLAIHVQTTKGITSHLLSSLNSAAPKQGHSTCTSKIPPAEPHPKPTSLQDMSCCNSLASADDVLGEVGAQHGCMRPDCYYYYTHSVSKQAPQGRYGHCEATWKV